MATGNCAYFASRGDWSISIGDNFGNSAANNSVIVTGSSSIRFELDLPNGRWRLIDTGACYADCDTSTGPLVCDIFDFLCFQDAFVSGCP